MSQFATALSWVPMSRNLAATMARACDYAGQQAHRHVTLEHLLLALTDDTDAAAVLSVSNVDLSLLGADVAAQVSRNDNRFAQHDVIDPSADETLVRILDYAAAAARQSRRREINGAVVLAAVIGDGNSTAATILKAHGLTFEAAIKALQRSSAQPKPSAGPEPVPAPVIPAPVAVPVVAPVAAPIPAPVAPPVIEFAVETMAAPSEPRAIETPTFEVKSVQEQSISGSASLANEAMLANVRRKLEATRATPPARPPITPIAPLAPPPMLSPPKLRPVTLPVATATAELVDESAGLATLAKHSQTPPVAAAPVAGTPSAFDAVAIAVPLPSPLPVIVPPDLPTMPTLPTPPGVAAVKSAGADLAKTHDGWLPPASPTLVTEAAKPARRPPPAPATAVQQPIGLELANIASSLANPAPKPEPKLGPETAPVAVPTSDWRPRDEPPVSQQPRESNRISQDAGPPRAPRSPSPAPWPETPQSQSQPQSQSSAPAPMQPRGSYQDAPPPVEQTSLREFQPVPAGANSHPDGGLYQPTNQQPYPVQARPHTPPQPGQNGTGAVPAGQWPPMPPQGPATAPFHMPPHGQPPLGHVPQQPQQRASTAAVITASVGKLTGSIPTHWRVSQAQPIEIRLSPDELRALALQLDGRGAAYAHEKIVAKALSVRLKAPDHHFAIEPTSPETLWLDAQALQMSNDGAHWRWQVTPQAGGKTKLQLVISARTVGADGVVAETALPDQSVTVKIGGNRRRLALKLLGYLGVLLLGAVLARYGEGGIETMLAWKRGFE